MIKIRKSEDGKFYYVVTASNGKVVTTSETYASKRNCKLAVEVFIYTAQSIVQNNGPVKEEIA